MEAGRMRAHPEMQVVTIRTIFTDAPKCLFPYQTSGVSAQTMTENDITHLAKQGKCRVSVDVGLFNPRPRERVAG
ncbi:MAG: hypothetical protein ACNA71_03795 [Kiritimatiellia bacterium]